MNSMTMLALSLSVGEVVDDAIVVLENSFRHGEMGKDPVTAAREGTNEVAFPVIASTLAIVAVFIPVAFIRGLIGRFYFQFGVTVSVAILISLFVAFTLTPMLCARFLNAKKRHGRLYNYLEETFSKIDGMYRESLAWSLNHRFLVIAVAVAIFIASLGLFKILGKELVQKEDRDDFVVRLETPVGTSLAVSDKKLAQCESILKEMPEVKSIFALMGAGGFTSVTNKGFMFVQLTDSRERTRTQEEIMSYLRKELNRLSGMVAYVEDIAAMGGGGMGRNAPLQFRIKGPDIMKLGEIATTVVDRLRTIEGIVGVGADMELTKPEVRVYIDRDKAGDLGVDVKTIASAISTLIGGREVSQYRIGGNSYDVRVRLIPEQRSMFQDINSLLVRNSAGELLRLSNVVDVREEIGPDVINRLDRQRSINIFADLEGKTLGEVIDQTKKIVDETLPPGYSITFAGQAETMAETFQSIIFAFYAHYHHHLHGAGIPV